MAEASQAAVGVITACAGAAALDALVVPGRATACRVADDEILFLCDLAVAGEVAREVETRLTVVDADAVVIDTSDGWTSIRIDGDDAHAVFASLSRLRLPDGGFAQGDVAHVPAKVLTDDDAIVLLAPASMEHHLLARLARAVEAAP